MEPLKRTPFVYWAQNEESISLLVDIHNAQEVTTQVLEDGRLLSFSATSCGMDITRNDQEIEYGFQLPLSDEIQEPIELKSHDNRVEIRLPKRNKGFWKNGLLSSTAQKQSYKWLKFDFEKWRDDPEEQAHEEMEEHLQREGAPPRNEYLEKMLRELEQDKNISLMSSEELAIKMNLIYGTYMFVYNLGMFIIHFTMLCLVLYRFVSTPKAAFFHDFWPNYFHTFVAITCLQYLDVFHSLTGLTRGSYKTSLLQVTGRLFMLFIINGCSPCTKLSAVFSLIVTYLLSEQFRYPYYALNTIGISIGLITWSRYNAWLLLYPIGLFLEGLIMVYSIPHYLQSGVYSLQMPNRLNMAFNFGYFLILFITTCFPYICLTLLKHMYRQRQIKMAEMRGEGKKKVA